MKITVFGLLRLVREGKAPKEIKYDTINYYFRNYDYKEIRGGLIDEQSSWLEKIDFYKFDEEVEIIEEDKKIEKLTIGKDDVAWCEGNMKTDEEMVDIVLEIKDKINEIIDYINGGTND